MDTSMRWIIHGDFQISFYNSLKWGKYCEFHGFDGVNLNELNIHVSVSNESQLQFVKWRTVKTSLDLNPKLM